MREREGKGEGGGGGLMAGREGEDFWPLTAFLAAMVVGPPREGIQKKPSVRRPSSAALLRARYRPMKTGMVARVGRQPARGLTPASL